MKRTKPEDAISKIIKILKIAKKPLTINTIAERANIAWETAERYLKIIEKIQREESLEKIEVGDKVFFKLKGKT